MSFMLLGILNAQASGGAAGAFDLLETTTLSTSASSVTFSGLGAYSDYKHLQVRALFKSNDAGTIANALNIRFNSDSGSNYAWHALQGTGSSVIALGSDSRPEIAIQNAVPDASSGTSNGFGPGVFDILDFSNSSKNTTLRALVGFPDGRIRVGLSSGLWNDTSSVTSIDFSVAGSFNFVSGTRFSLIGVK